MKIIVTDGYVENPGDLSWAPLEALGEVTYYDRIGLTDEDETIRRIGDAEIAVINKAPVTRKVIDSCPNLKLITVMATGYNVVDVVYAKEKGIPVCNVPNYGGYSVSQFTIALMLEACLHIGHHDRTVHEGKWQNSPDWCLSLIHIFSVMLPPFILSTVLILLCCLLFPKDRLTVPEAQVVVARRRAVVYGGLFCLAVAMVLRLIPYGPGLAVIVLALWFLDRHALKTVDWGLLATFAAFFTFSGNLARMEPVRMLFVRLLSHGTMLISALTCQIISNVPAAILLSRFTQDARGLLVGVNVGGAGTLVASLASLITFREYTRRVPGGAKRFLILFSAISFAFLAVLLAAMSFLG